MINLDSVGSAETYATQKGLKWPAQGYMHGAAKSGHEGYAVRFIPHKVLIGKDGKVKSNAQLDWADVVQELAAPANKDGGAPILEGKNAGVDGGSVRLLHGLLGHSPRPHPRGPVIIRHPTREAPLQSATPPTRPRYNPRPHPRGPIQRKTGFLSVGLDRS